MDLDSLGGMTDQWGIGSARLRVCVYVVFFSESFSVSRRVRAVGLHRARPVMPVEKCISRSLIT
jgi:hypothetical protein